MLSVHIPNTIWAFVAGAFIAAFALAVAFQYLPSPNELFRDGAAECRQAGVHKDNEAHNGQRNSGEPPSVIEQPDTAKTKNEPANQKEINDCLLAAYTGSLSDFTKWLVFVTGTVAIFGFWQVLIARNTARRELRAYVLTGNIGFGYLPDGRIQSAFQIKNDGPTPAHGVHCAAHLMTLEFPLAESALNRFPVDVEGGGKESKFVVGPNGAFVSGFGRSKRAFTLEEVNRALQDHTKSRLYCFGIIRYLDIFGRTRTTKFCYSIYNDAGYSPPFSIDYSPVDNEAD